VTESDVIIMLTYFPQVMTGFDVVIMLTNASQFGTFINTRSKRMKIRKLNSLVDAY
jgi:hypothetical protein